jgi:NAD(P)-dependent dehydrogenase (short-subunit alcohol dehydrogenase family)
VRAEVGVPDVVVNNAGIAIIGSFLEHTEEDWNRIVGINLLGVARGCRLFGAQMVQRAAGGHLVNIASVAAWAPTTALPAYSATKAGVRMLSECLRAELASHRIGVTAICPGFTSTGIARAAHYVGVPAAQERRLREATADGLAKRKFPAEKVALAVMRAVLANKSVVPVNTEAWITYSLSRLSPAVLGRLLRGADKAMRVE